MKRFIFMLLKNPLQIFKLIYYYFVIRNAKRKGIRTIVFNLHHDYFYDILYPVYKRLKQHKNIRIYFAYLHKKKPLIEYLEKRIEKKLLISNRISPFINFDLFICPEITGPDFPVSFLKTKTIEVYHGNGISAFYEKKDVLNRFDVHFTVGPKFNEFLDFAYKDKTQKPTIYNVGYPKLDILLQEYLLTKRLEKEYKTKNKFTILHAPHWNPFGSLHAFGVAIIEMLASFDVQLLIKPHHYLYAQYPEMDWKGKLEELENRFDNIVIIKRPNTQEVYPLADVMISDTGTSAPFEYSLLKRPLFIFCNEDWFEGEQHAYEERRICETSICFKKLDELKKYIQQLLTGSPEMKKLIEEQKKKQEKLISDLLYNPGTAAERSYQAVLKELGL
ncbi:MAG: CDP-glycerol glycerophosphotransferase family protein [Candidatus Cloacimonetes bacterium]|nr:CDP-glycerol glycerophosphotransferase family protein [Candidatus Cloacimonadota bacterium]